jgi:hypothetical protein
MYSQDEKDGMAMSNKTIDKFAAKRDCPDGYYWNGTECVKKAATEAARGKQGLSYGVSDKEDVAKAIANNGIKPIPNFKGTTTLKDLNKIPNFKGTTTLKDLNKLKKGL